MNKIINFIITVVIIILLTFPVLGQNTYKSPAKAFFYSLLVPGLGQKYVDSNSKMWYALTVESVLIGLAVGHESYSNWLEEDYSAFAAAHAGITPAGKNKSYFVAISRYSSLYRYNDQMRIDREFNRIIPETPENIWVWDSDANRYYFYDRRLKAELVHNRTKYFYSCIVLNHLINSIYAAIKANRYNARIKAPQWNLSVISPLDPAIPPVMVKITYYFLK